MKCARSNVVLMAFAISYSLFTVNYSLATEPPAAVTPYTFLGRVMDSTHVAFDGDRAATIEVSDASGKFLARTATFFRADSRRNYSLDQLGERLRRSGHCARDRGDGRPRQGLERRDG